MVREYVFGAFRLDPRERRLSRNGELVHLEPKSFDVLTHLVGSAGRLVVKGDLIDAVWSGVVVTDNSLTRCIRQIRVALGDDAEAPRYIETVTGSGYRFVATVTAVDEDVAAEPVVRHSWWRFLALSAVVAAVVLLIAFPFRPQTGISRLAVLPFEDLSADAGQRHIALGVHEALIAELSRLEGIDVISRTSVMRYEEAQLSLPEIAAQLDVDGIVEGSVHRDGENLTVTAQLIALAPERHLWVERFHRNVADVFEITTEISRKIAEEIAMDLSATQALSSTQHVDPAAVEAYARGRVAFENGNLEGFREAQRLFEQAIEVDATFARAYVALADTFGSVTVFGMRSPAEGMLRVRALIEQALRIDSTLAEAHRALAAVSFYGDWDWDAAERSVRRALALNPSSVDAHRLLSEVLSVTGRHRDAFAAVERARQLDPNAPMSQAKPALILYLARDYGAASAVARDALESHPRFWQTHWLLCLSQSALANHGRAVDACRAAAELSGRTPMALAALGYVHAAAGNVADARAVLAELSAQRAERYVGPATFAIVQGALGDRDAAIAALEQAYVERDQLLIHAQNYGFFDPLRSDPRFRTPSGRGAANDHENVTES